MEHPGMVIDTSVFIEFLRAKNKKETTLFRIPEENQLYISAITLYELLMGANNSEKLNDIKILTDDIPVLSFNETVAKQAGDIYHKLRKSNKIIEFRDIFIAATAISNNFSVKTLNVKHFNRIPNIRMS
jgi:predicted nucleic acid-binding protein